MHFTYLGECRIKMPAAVRSRNQKYYLKTGVRPPSKWGLDLVVKSVELPQGHAIQLTLAPEGDEGAWHSSILAMATQANVGEVYEIEVPVYTEYPSMRTNRRFVAMQPVSAHVEGASDLFDATCVDISETGFGLRFEETSEEVVVGKECRIRFPDFPPLVGKIVRILPSNMDGSLVVGVQLLEEYRKHASQIVGMLEKREERQTPDGDVFFPSEESNRGGTSSWRGALQNIFGSDQRRR
jgi:hypothetical protein